MGRWQGTTTQRGLGWTHVKDKERLLAAHRDGDPCWRCGHPMYKTQALDRDHVIDRTLGGITGPAVLAHASCNRAAGARAGNQGRQFTPAAAVAGRNVTCRVCGQHYSRAARACEMCGAHYHPTYGEQRTCGRACGVILIRRNKMARGWAPSAEQPQSPPKLGPGRVRSSEREPMPARVRHTKARMPQWSACSVCGNPCIPGHMYRHLGCQSDEWRASRAW